MGEQEINTLNLEADGLQRQQTTAGSSWAQTRQNRTAENWKKE